MSKQRSRCHLMYRKALIIFALFTTLFSIFSKDQACAYHILDVQNDSINVLIVYSNDGSENSSHVDQLSILLQHFTSNITVVSDEEFENNQLQYVTHLIYYGESKKELADEVIKQLNDFKGPFIIIGKNKEQFHSFNQFKTSGLVKVDRISDRNEKNTFSLDYPILIEQLNESNDIDVLLYSYKGQQSYPLFVRDNQRYYFTVTELADTYLINYFSELLHSILPNNHDEKHMAFLRLENIHPLADPDILLEVGEYLNARNIPYLLEVNPVYIDTEHGEHIALSQSPELVSVLRHLQDTGGTIVLGGFSVGEEDNLKKNSDVQLELKNPPLSKDMFANMEQYTDYALTLEEEKKKQVESLIENTVTDLVSYELYPISIYLPHHLRAKMDYSILANHFTSLFGHVQLTEAEGFDRLFYSPVITTSDFLNGVTLYPETIEFVNSDVRHSESIMKKNLEKLSIVRDSIINVAYPAYLGVEELDLLINNLSYNPHLEWIDLSKTDQHVHVQGVEMTLDDVGSMMVHNNLEDRLIEGKSHSTLEKILWGVTLLVLSFITIFIIITLYLRTQLKKQLFKETK